MKKLKIVKNRRIILSIIVLFSTTILTLRCFKKVYPNNIYIFGGELFTKDEILKNSNINFPKPLLFVKTKYAEQQLKKNLYLSNVSITRQILPFGLKIFIQTRQPIAYGEKIENGKEIKGFVDRNGFFIDEKFADIKNLKDFSTSIFGWKYEYIRTISEILNYSFDHNIIFKKIIFSSNGFLILEEVNLKKIILGNNTKILETQMKAIRNIKNELTDENFLEKIDTIDLRDPKNPKIKVFKP